LAAARRRAILRFSHAELRFSPKGGPGRDLAPVLQIVSPSAQPPEGEGWLHEVKHDGHRLLASAAMA
jgi:ATP-dependent DNA ligase